MSIWLAGFNTWKTTPRKLQRQIHFLFREANQRNPGSLSTTSCHPLEGFAVLRSRGRIFGVVPPKVLDICFLNKSVIPALTELLRMPNKLPKPKLCTLPQYETIEKRNRRQQKLRARPQTVHQEVEQKMLRSLDNPQVSFDSSVHDIYKEHQQITAQINQFELPYDPSHRGQLWEYDDLDDFAQIATNLNQKEAQRIGTKVKDKFLITKFFKTSKVIEAEPQKRKPIPNLHLQQVLPSNIMQLMQQYSRGIVKRGFNTDRNPDTQNLTTPIDDTSSYRVHQVKSALPEHKSTSKVGYNSHNERQPKPTTIKPPKLIRVEEKTVDRNKKKVEESVRLLSMLRQQNLSQPNSPFRRLEIKLNLNRLILEQQSTIGSTDNSYGFWTSRNKDQKPPSKFQR